MLWHLYMIHHFYNCVLDPRTRRSKPDSTLALLELS